MTLTELSARTGITIVNLSVLKNNRGRAIRFTTLTAICDALDTTPGDLFTIADSASFSPAPADTCSRDGRSRRSTSWGPKPDGSRPSGCMNGSPFRTIVTKSAGSLV